MKFAKLKNIFNEYQSKINNNADKNLKTLTIVYYAGHGMMKENQSQIVLPDA